MNPRLRPSRRAFLGGAACAVAGVVPATRAAPARGPARGIVDLHAHLVPRAYAQRFGAPAAYARGPALTDADEDVARRLAIMDAAGVATQVLSIGAAPYAADEDRAVAAARLLNDAYARVCAAHPGRLAGLVSLPLPHMAASLAELRRGLDELGMVGVGATSACLGVSIADDRFAPLFAELNARGAALVIHPAANGFGAPLLTGWGLGGPGVILEDTVVALQLMQKAIPLRFPRIRILLPHLGGSLALMLPRLDRQLTSPDGPLAEPPSRMARRFWYDTVSHGSGTALRAAVEAFGANRIVPGSDFPVLLAFESYAETFGYVRRAGLGAGVAERILHRNARRVVGV